MRNSKGEVLTSRVGIANVFADFYEQLYRASGTDATWKLLDVQPVDMNQFSAFTAQELADQLRKMANGKAADESGLDAEVLKICGNATLEVLAQLFTEVMDPNKEPPAKWRKTKLKVLFKKGDSLDPANYRPIASLPILYKLFTRCLCGRIGPTLDAQQSVDQAGFRKGFSCDDHLFVIRQLSEKASEYRLPLWVVAIDYQKAFDSFSHTALWSALKDHDVPHVYINALQRLYKCQTGAVLAGESSREFPILRGSRQGDPISPILFNAILEKIMRACIEKWNAKGWGWSLDEVAPNLTNLRFADDLLLTARSLFQAKACSKMLTRPRS